MKRIIWSILLVLNLSSFAQKDTLDYEMKRWTVDEYQNKTKLPLDTFLDGFQIYNPIYQQDFSHAFSGNTGQAYQNTYFLNRQDEAFMFFKPYSAYLFKPENNAFFNTKQHYTHLKYFSNLTKKNNLQNLDLLHTQNIMPNLNLGFQYRLIGADGEYKAQKTSNHFFRAFGSYEHKNYEAFIVYNYNKFNSELNAGLTSDTLLDNPNNNTDDTKLLPINLENSANAMLGRNLNFKHSFLFNKALPREEADTITPIINRPVIKIGHEIDWNYNKRLYSADLNLDFYQQFHIDTSLIEDTRAVDSTGYSSFNNTFFVTFLDDTLNSAFPALSIAYINSQEFFHSYNNNSNYTHHTGKLFLSNPVFKKWYWDFGAAYTFMGRNQGDFDVNGTVQKFFGKNNQHHIRFQPSFSHTSTNVFAQTFTSTFFKWDDINEEKFALTTFDFAYKHEKLKLEVGVKQAYLDNYVYFASKQDSINYGDTLMIFENIAGYPFQETSTFGILTFYLNHQLDWGAFHMKNSVTYQKISNDSTLHLPDFTFYNSTYFQMRFFKRVLTAQIGFDVRYNSAYLIDGFNPATGMFYNQYQKEFGDYPYVDFFINLKLKRARLFFKFEHANKGLNGNQYYTVLNHPMNPRVFRFGLSWRFWN